MANLKSLYAKLLQGIKNYGDDALQLTPYADDVIRSDILQNSYPITAESFDGLKDTIQKAVANNDNVVSLSQLEDMIPSNPTGDYRDMMGFDLKNHAVKEVGTDRYLKHMYDRLRNSGRPVINPDIDFKLGR